MIFYKNFDSCLNLQLNPDDFQLWAKDTPVSIPAVVHVVVAEAVLTAEIVVMAVVLGMDAMGVEVIMVVEVADVLVADALQQNRQPLQPRQQQRNHRMIQLNNSWPTSSPGVDIWV